MRKNRAEQYQEGAVDRLALVGWRLDTLCCDRRRPAGRSEGPGGSRHLLPSVNLSRAGARGGSPAGGSAGGWKWAAEPSALSQHRRRRRHQRVRCIRPDLLQNGTPEAASDLAHTCQDSPIGVDFHSRDAIDDVTLANK